MKCLEFKSRLQEWMDEQGPRARGATSLGSLAQAHIGQCKSCREQFAAAQRLMEGVKLFPRPATSSVESRSIVALVLRERAQQRVRFQRRFRQTIALAASILIMVIAGYILEPQPRNVPEPGTIVNLDAPKREIPKAEPVSKEPPALARTIDEATDKVAALTEKWSDRTMERARQLLAAAPSLKLPHMSSSLLPDETLDATASLKKAGQEISEGLQPVTRSARRALDLFMREMSTLEVSGAN